MRLLRGLLAIVVLFAVVAFVLNTKLFAPSMEGKPTLLAHRGVAQTFPPEGIFTQDAETIARAMASKKVSPRGIGSAIRMVQFFINRAGKGLSKKRKQELEKAKRILQAKRNP